MLYAMTLYRPVRTEDGEGGWTSTYSSPKAFYGMVNTYMGVTTLLCRTVVDVRPEDIICVRTTPLWREQYYRVLGSESPTGAGMKSLPVEVTEKPFVPVPPATTTSTSAATTTTTGAP